VIHYDVSIPGPASVLFLSGSSQPGPQFRLSYELKGSTMFGKFQMRAPGRTEFHFVSGVERCGKGRCADHGILNDPCGNGDRLRQIEGK